MPNSIFHESMSRQITFVVVAVVLLFLVLYFCLFLLQGDHSVFLMMKEMESVFTVTSVGMGKSQTKTE